MMEKPIPLKIFPTFLLEMIRILDSNISSNIIEIKTIEDSLSAVLSQLTLLDCSLFKQIYALLDLGQLYK